MRNRSAVHLLFGQAAGAKRLLVKVFLEHAGRAVYETAAAHR